MSNYSVVGFQGNSTYYLYALRLGNLAAHSGLLKGGDFQRDFDIDYHFESNAYFKHFFVYTRGMI